MRSSLRALFSLVFFLLGAAGAQSFQGFSAESFYNRCAQSFNAGDLETARSYCDNALAVNPDLAPALRLMTRVALGQEKPDEARTFLNRARAAAPDAVENDLLEAEIAVAKQDYSRAAQLSRRLAGDNRLSSALIVRSLRVASRAALAEGRDADAAESLQRLLALQPDDLASRRALADLREQEDPRAAITLLREAPNPRSPVVLAELGRAQWIAGELDASITTLERALANPAAFNNTPGSYQRALGALAYAYYGDGRFADGAQVLRQLSGQQNVYGLAVSRVLPWLVAFVALLALHLIGESRIEPLSTIEIQEGPRAWTVSNVYGLLILALAAGAVTALLVGRLAYNNYLAFLTPYQSGLVQDVHFTVFSIVLAAGSVYVARRGGWNARELLVGPARRDIVADGFLVGLLLLGVTVAYQFVARWLPDSLSAFYLSVQNPRVTILLPLLFLPLTELFFRAFALYPVEKRYGRDVAYSIVTLIYALALGTPIILLAVVAAILLAFTNRAKSTAPAVVARWVFYAGLIVLPLVVPVVRTWF